MVKRLEEKAIVTAHTFDSNKQKARRQKMGFYLGSEKVKATTIHSFKGWESRILVIQIEPVSGAQAEHVAAVYCALTRVKLAIDGISFISVICSDPLFEEYGKTWPNGFHC